MLLSSIDKFNVLAFCLARKSKDQVKIAMTSPVTITFHNYFVNNTEMSFVLPEDISSTPLSYDISISQTPATMRIVKRFTGFGTNLELLKQRKKLIDYIEKLNLY